MSCATIARSLSPLCRAPRRARANSFGVTKTGKSSAGAETRDEPPRAVSVRSKSARRVCSISGFRGVLYGGSSCATPSVCVCAEVYVATSFARGAETSARSGAGTDAAAVSRGAAASVAVDVPVPVPVPVPASVASHLGGRGMPGSEDAAARSWNAARSRCSAADARRSADSARADACSSWFSRWNARASASARRAARRATSAA